MEENIQNPWIDITVSIEEGMVTWPGDLPVLILPFAQIKEGEEANVTGFSMSAHTGTHIDAPLHFFDKGKDVTEIPLSVLAGPVKLFQVRDLSEVSLEEIRDFDIRKGDRVLFKTRNSDLPWAMKPFRQDYVALTTGAAEYLAEKELACVGIDYLSIAGLKNGTEVHRLLLGAGICIVEGLDLAGVEPGEYEMICLPLKLKGSDGAPARVILRKRN